MKRASILLSLAVLATAAVTASLVHAAPPAPPAPATPPASPVPPGAAPAAPAAPGVNAGKIVKLPAVVPDGKAHKFEARDKQFFIDGQPTLLVAGEMHFGRTLPEDFETRVKQAKAMGLNTLSFYLFWNLVEPEEGKFDFTGMNDVKRMFKICQDNGMWVVLRPGPYCCAEVEYGGIPYWTAKGDNAKVKIRSTDPKYLEWSKNYITRVSKEISEFQVSKGGPLLMVQLENEYAMVAPVSGGFDYVKALAPMFRNAGIDVPLYVCDPGSFVRGNNPYGNDILWARNGMGTSSASAYNTYLAVPGDFPLFSPEVYTAWFAGWGQPLPVQHTSINEVTTATSFFLDHNMSWCYYVFFGGTNWGYNTGCNEWLPVQTSYDYSAPVDEAGRTTEKFAALRAILADRTGRTLPQPPANPAVVELPAIKFTEHEPLIAALPAAPTQSAAKPISMEDLNQAYGFVLYRKQFPQGLHGKLELKQVMDYAVTMVNGKTVGKSFIGYGPDSNTIAVDQDGPATLDILVHNLGRISVITSLNSQARARKGLIGGATLDGTELSDWQMYSLPLNSVENFKASPVPHTGPGFYHATFNVDKPASTFLDLSNFSMGVVWVNGHNLGRFWDRGASRALFLSEHFLKPGSNDITVLELHDAPRTPEITGKTAMVATQPVPFSLRLDTATPAPAAGRGGAPAGRGNRGGAAGTPPATLPG